MGVQLQDSSYQAAIRVDEVCREYAVLYRNPRNYRELLEKFGLGKLEKSQVVKLSGGERQKLSVVLALIGNPEIVFLDVNWCKGYGCGSPQGSLEDVERIEGKRAYDHPYHSLYGRGGKSL